MNFAIFDGWINSQNDTDTSDPSTKVAVNPDHVGVVLATDEETSERPETVIIMAGYQDEWYTVRGTHQETINMLKMAGKKF